MYFHNYKGGWGLIEIALLSLIYSTGNWWRDVIREAVYEGFHTEKVLVGLALGMLLFIVSEIMFFFCFFLVLFLLKLQCKYCIRWSMATYVFSCN